MKSEDLDDLARAYPECLIAAYADIGSGITLRTAASTDVPSEALEELCGEAALSLGLAEPPLGMAACPMAIKAVHNAVFLYLRSPQDPNDALIAMCRANVPLEAFIEDAQACFEDEA